MVQRELPQYIADGEPALPLYTPLRAHLAGCPICLTYAARLRVVEDGLHTYPLVALTEDIGGRVQAVVDLECQAGEEQWHLWQWDLWLPAAALVVAMVIAILAMPADAVSWGAWAQTPAMGPQALSGWLDSMRQDTGSSVFWAVWIGIFVTTAGLGIGLSLAGWSRRQTERLSDIESQVTGLANRVWAEARRAR